MLRPIAGSARWHDLDLVVMLDDASACIYSVILVEQGAMSSLLSLHETMATHGLFGALYVPRRAFPLIRRLVVHRHGQHPSHHLRVPHCDVSAPLTPRSTAVRYKRLAPLLRLAGIGTAAKRAATRRCQVCGSSVHLGGRSLVSSVITGWDSRGGEPVVSSSAQACNAKVFSGRYP